MNYKIFYKTAIIFLNPYIFKQGEPVVNFVIGLVHVKGGILSNMIQY